MIEHIFMVRDITVGDGTPGTYAYLQEDRVTLVPDHVFNRDMPGHNGRIKSEIQIETGRNRYKVGDMVKVMIYTEEELMEKDKKHSSEKLERIIQGAED